MIQFFFFKKKGEKADKKEEMIQMLIIQYIAKPSINKFKLEEKDEQ